MKRNAIFLTVLAFILASCSGQRELGITSSDNLAGGGAGLALGLQSHDLFVVDTIKEVIGENDLQFAKKAQLDALEKGRTGIALSWKNPNTKQVGEVIPGPNYSINGRACRDFNHVVKVRGDVVQGRGIACKRDDGTWQSLAAS